MKSLLLAQKFSFATSWPILLLLVLLVAMLVVSMVTRKKQGDKQAEMLNELKAGDKVVTNAGIYGEIVSITETNFGKIALIKSGEGKNVSYINVNMSVILGKDTKEEIVLDQDGNVIEPEKKEEKTEKAEKQEVKEEKKEEVEKVEETGEEAKEPAKKSTKKSTSKKSSSTKK